MELLVLVSVKVDVLVVAAVGYCLGIQRWYIVGMVLIWRQGSRTKYVGVWYRVFFA
jgi:hypothetical protein